MLSALGRRAQAWTSELDPFTNVYGVARSLLALATAGTYLATPLHVLFFPANAVDVPVCGGVRSAGVFCLSHGSLDAARWLSIVILLVVASGWRPRFTGILHAWVAFSLQANALGIEGGDQAAAILALLLVPVTLLDDRRWHWQPRKARALDEKETYRRLIARVCFTLIRVQVAGIYFHAAIGKFKVDEWTDGTAVYYWFTHPTFGASSWMLPVIRPLVLSGAVVSLMTWGTLVLEFLLAAALISDRRWRPYLLVAGFGLHGGIMLVHGLVSFALIMFGALVLFLRPLDAPFRWLHARALHDDAERLREDVDVEPRRPVAHVIHVDLAAPCE